MQLPRLRTVLLIPFVLFALLYVAAAVRVAVSDNSVSSLEHSPAAYKTIVVFGAPEISSVGVDEKTYGMIHVDFPVQFVNEWTSISDKPDISFHYISSSDISEDSSAMWAGEKVRAERTLFEIAAETNLRVIAYRPDYIGPTEEEAHLGQNLLYWFFSLVNSAVRATQIGEAMLDVTARGPEFKNGDRLGTWSIIRYSDAYERRL